MIFTLTREKKDSWTGIQAYDQCTVHLRPELNERGELVTGLTPDEARKLEAENYMTAGTLAPNSDYWHEKFMIPFNGKAIKFDDTIPSDKIKLAVLRSMKKVAVGRDELKKKSKAIFLLASKEMEIKSDSERFDYKEKAWRLYLNLPDTQLRQVAVVLEREKPKGRLTDISSMTTDAIRNNLRSEVERDPKLFTSVAEDEDLATKFEILQLVTDRVISVNNSGYYHRSDMLGPALDDAVLFFKDPHNQPRVIQIKKEGETRSKR